MREGRERASIDRTLVLTGLRRRELASITVGQADLNGPVSSLRLHARMSSRGAEIPLRKEIISKTDERGRAGVPRRTGQVAMRHSDPSHIVNACTDPTLRDVARAVDPPARRAWIASISE